MTSYLHDIELLTVSWKQVKTQLRWKIFKKNFICDLLTKHITRWNNKIHYYHLYNEKQVYKKSYELICTVTVDWRAPLTATPSDRGTFTIHKQRIHQLYFCYNVLCILTFFFFFLYRFLYKGYIWRMSKWLSH